MDAWGGEQWRRVQTEYFEIEQPHGNFKNRWVRQLSELMTGSVLVGMGCEVTSGPLLNPELQLFWLFCASHRLLFS